MAQENVVLGAFNRGIVSRLALARVDLKRVALSAEQQTNWMPRTLGSMMLRTGLQYLGETLDDAQAVHIPFFYAIDDLAICEITEGAMRVYVNDAVITRAAVSSAVTNGNFDTDLTGWTDADESGGVSQWATGGYMSLAGTGTNSAIRRQEVSVAGADQGDEHALRVVIQRGPVTLKVGSTSGASDYIREVSLATGTHSLAFTPTGNFWIELSGRLSAAALVASINVEAAGAMELPVPWQEEDLSYLRWDQSADVLFVACRGYQQRRIQRTLGEDDPRTWSVILYQPSDGPFRTENLTPTTITPSGISGNVTLTASRSIFNAGHVGALFSLTSQGQRVEATITAENTFSDPIRVTGVGASRSFAITLSGTWSATVRLQRSIEEPGTWEDVSGQSWTGNITTSYSDGLDNQIVFYRIGVKTGEFTSGSIAAALNYSFGSIRGVTRITAFSSGTSVSAEVLDNLGGTAATDIWAEGVWSDFRGWPSAVALVEGRLGWAGKDRGWLSVSDAFESFDPDVEGDAGPIIFTLGTGAVDTANWMLALQRLLIGGAAAELSVRSSSFDEILTPTNRNIKPASTQGSAAVAAVRVDANGIMVQRSGQRVYELSQADGGFYDYTATDLTALVPDLNNAGITKIAVQRQPDTRLHCIRADGTAGVLIFDKAENVICWIDVETDGEIEDVVVLPGTGEDRVYYTVMRTIDSVEKRYFEKFALESECQGGTLNKQADSFATFTNGPASATVSGLGHLEGKSVVVWADGKCMRAANGGIATFTVTGCTITLTNGGASYSATTGIVGLQYTARFKSTKLAYAAAMGTPLNMRKRVHGLGLILSNTHYQGLKFGRDFDHLVSMDRVVGGKTTPEDTIWPAYDNDPMVFPGDWMTDSRVCLQAQAPRPATVLAAVIGMATYDRS